MVTLKEDINKLLKKRYEVIGLWPGNCPFHLGDILHETNNETQFCEDFPHLFRPMHWFEGKLLEELLPKYLKAKPMAIEMGWAKYFEILRYSGKSGAYDHFRSTTDVPGPLLLFLPCTEEEYLEHTNQTHDQRATTND